MSPRHKTVAEGGGGAARGSLRGAPSVNKKASLFYDGLEHNIDHGLAFEAGKSEVTIPKKARFADDSACMISKQSSNRPPSSSSK